MAQPTPEFVFGIYPGGAAGGDAGLLSGTADDSAAVVDCLNRLQGSSSVFVVRVYDSFQDSNSPLVTKATAPADYAQYAIPGRRPMDLVLQYRSASANIAGYLDFVREKIQRNYKHLYAVQITEEPNFTDGPDVIDGPYPQVQNALVQGVITAKQTLRGLGAEHVKVGFNATPTFGPAASFWSQLRALSSPEFFVALDYVGLDFFPDVFRPLASDGQPGDLVSAAAGILEMMRNIWLPAAQIPQSVAIHITEHGWPTGPARPAERQAVALEKVIRTVHSLRARLNIERYTLFGLRDVDILRDDEEYDKFRYFGITDANYVPKPAFQTFRSLVSELSSGAGDAARSKPPLA